MAHLDSWTLDALIGAYKEHQRRTRGLREKTLYGHERVVRLLVHSALGDDPIDPTQLTPSDVIEFVALLRNRYSLALPRLCKAPHSRGNLIASFAGAKIQLEED